MQIRPLIAGFTVLAFVVQMPAAESEVEQLKVELRQLQATFAETRRQQQKQIEDLTRKIDALSAGAAASTPPTPASSLAPAPSSVPPVASADDEKKLEAQLAAELLPAIGSAPVTGPSNRAPETAATAVPSAGTRTGSSYMNLSYGAAMTAGGSTQRDPAQFLELGDHDPLKRGFALRNAEIAVDGAVDPYFKGFANIVLKLDRNNETSIELEESYLESASLPANLQLKAGQYFAAFGRQNPQHPHMWAFVDQPLILGRAFGPDGLRSLGAQLSWLAPTPFYTEVFLSVFDGQGGTAFSFRNPGELDTTGIERYAGRMTIDRPLRGAQDLLFVPRVASSFELSETQTVLAGISGAFGPNDTGPDRRTAVYGADLFWKWKPANAAQGFPYVTWQTEALWRRFEAGADPLAATPLPGEILRDSGFYSQLVWGVVPRWNVGLRADYVTGNHGVFDASDPFRGRRHRFSPELTFFPSEFSKIRLQYNYDHGDLFGFASSIWMQIEFGLGAHAAHKY